MSSLVFAVHGLRSALNNTTALARILVERGHQVTFVSFRDVRSDVEHVGARFVLLDSGPAAVRQLAMSRSSRGNLRSFGEARRLRAQLLDLAEPNRVLRDLKPDAAIIDIEMHGVVLAASRLGLASAHTLSWHDPMRSWSRPPMHRELAMPVSQAERLRIRAAWIDLIARRRARQFAGPLLPRAALARILPQQLNTPDFGTIKAMARRTGVDLSDIASRHDWINPVTYTHRPILSYTVKELEFDQQTSPGVNHIGPVIDVDRYERSTQTDSAAVGLDSFVARFADADRKLAYCSMGSLQASNVAYYQRVIDAFSTDPTWGLIIGLGSQGTASALRVDSDRVLVLDDAPQLKIFEHCDVAIHTGGASTFYECLRFGVPSLVMHTGRTDMPGIAARVTHFKLGSVLDRVGVDSRGLYVEAERLAGGAFARELERVRLVIAGYEERQLGVELIEALAADHES